MIEFKRLGNYLKLLSLLTGKKLITSCGVIVLVILLFLVSMKMLTVQISNQYCLIFVYVLNFFLVLNLSVQISRIFNNLHSRNKIMSELSLPISNLERFIGNILFNFVVFFILIFLANLILGFAIDWLFGYAIKDYFSFFVVHNIFEGIFYYAIIIFCYFFAGSIFFKSAFFKTLISMVGIYILILFIGIFTHYNDGFNFSTSLYIQENTNFEYKSFNLQSDSSTEPEVRKSEITENQVFIVLGLFFLFISYFKLKKIQLK